MPQSPFVHSPSPHPGRLIPLPKQGETPEVWFDPESSISAHDQVRIVARLRLEPVSTYHARRHFLLGGWRRLMVVEHSTPEMGGKPRIEVKASKVALSFPDGQDTSPKAGTMRRMTMESHDSAQVFNVVSGPITPGLVCRTIDAFAMPCLDDVLNGIGKEVYFWETPPIFEQYDIILGWLNEIFLEERPDNSEEPDPLAWSIPTVIPLRQFLICLHSVERELARSREAAGGPPSANARLRGQPFW